MWSISPATIHSITDISLCGCGVPVVIMCCLLFISPGWVTGTYTLSHCVTSDGVLHGVHGKGQNLPWRFLSTGLWAISVKQERLWKSHAKHAEGSGGDP